MKLPDSVTRALRTFFQSAIGTFLSFLVVPHLNNANYALPSLSTLHAAIFSAAFAGVISVLTYLHNSLEDLGAVPVLGKLSGADKVIAGAALDAAIKQVQNQAVIYVNGTSSSATTSTPTVYVNNITKSANPAPAAAGVSVASSAVDGATVSTEPPTVDPAPASVAADPTPEASPPAAA